MPPRKKPAPKRVGTPASDDESDEHDGAASREHLDLSLPPISNIHEIFDDVVKRNADALAELFTALDRPLRVATMCSGTESPILALKLMLRSLEAQKGIKASVQHVFSAEIEPFKQAYIERNFHPPLLFRDVCELPNEKARTAYGAFAEVPQHADMLIAGTSCVDFSTLNNLKKGLEDDGESGRTFFGMFRWVEKARPKIVILENVLSATWGGMIENFESIDYVATHVRLDTKKYYVPHTRTRGYLIAFPRPKKDGSLMSALSAGRMAERWASKMSSLSRSASSPAEAFLLDSDDVRVHRARAELSQRRATQLQGKQRDATDWARCQQRHSIARTLEKLGGQKPLTGWSAQGGKPTMPDGAWQDWAEAQTERVLDLMDISYLRQARMGVDIMYKSAIWNLSQNVDRTTSSKLFGITPCLTPNMIPYLTNRGGPVVGIEALALQGLPIDELLLTRESTDQLADLAGNAMSSTVVGTAILSALLIAADTLDDAETVEKALRGDKAEDAEDADMSDVAPVGSQAIAAAEPTNEELEARLRGADRLVEHPVDLASHQPAPADLLERAHRSARKCPCEGPLDVSQHAISTCAGCGHSACTAHQGKPKHRYGDAVATREPPAQFERDLKTLLPMRVTLPGFDRAEMGRVLERALEKGGNVEDELVKQYLDTIADALGTAEFHFQHVSRRAHWTAVYGSDKARLELFFAATGMEWRVFVDPPRDLGTLDPLRAAFEQPIARIKVAAGTTDLLAGQWDLSIPLSGLKTRLDMGFGPLVESWRARLGLEEFKDEKRPSTIKMAFQGDTTLLDRQIDGTYELEAECGTATNALYRRVEPAEATPLFFFFDPSPYLEAPHDRFVFAETCSRTSTVRPLIASLDPSWRLNGTVEKGDTANRAYAPKDPSRRPEIFVTHCWEPLPHAKIVAGASDVNEASKFSTIGAGNEVSVADDKCDQAELLLTAHVPLAKPPSVIWARETWHEVDLQHEGPEVFSKLGWMLARVPEWDALYEFQTVDSASLPTHACFRCAPDVPKIDWIRRWTLGTGIKNPWKVSITAREDGLQAAAYETSLKNRPAPILVHTRQVGNEFQFKVALNAASLSHRVLAQLPSPRPDLTEVGKPVVSWRLLTEASADLGPAVGVKFSLKSNRSDPEAANPTLFKKHALRTEQLRSLHWMIEQEESPKPWIEEEVAEALLPQLGWQAEAKATREVVVRGGVLADAVGYGKTAITLALIAARKEQDAKLPEQTDRVPLKATLVVVPKHLFGQWGTEIKKFAGSGLKFLAISDVTKLKQHTLADYQDADVVVIAQSILSSERFWPYTADFAASHVDIKTDESAGRYFRHCVAETMDALGDQVKRLATEGSKAAFDAIQSARKNRFNVTAEEDFIPLTRKMKNKKSKVVDPNFKAPPKPTAGRQGKEQIESDPWGLQDKAVRRDWTELQGPPLAMFLWARVVLDEFSYIDGADLVGFHTCRGRSRWILSGTPPLRDFSEVKSIANLLNVHLGINDDSEGVADAVKTRNNEATMAEKFRSYCDVRTRTWHVRRDQVAQRFLDQYARQNIAEIDDIPLEVELVGVRLPGAEMAIYRELEHHLVAVDPALAKIAKVKVDKQSDRDKRLREALGQSKTPDEALLKRCSHFSLDLDEDEIAGGEAPDVCDFIHDLRERQLDDCKKQVKRHIIATAWLHRACDKKRLYQEVQGSKRNFEIWVQKLYSEGFGDAAADECLKKLALAAGVKDGKIGADTKDAPNTKDVADFNKRPDKYTDQEYTVYRVNLVRIAGVTLNKLTTELVGRYRSARYFDKVRNVLRKGDSSSSSTDSAILSCCGHDGKLADVEEAVARGRCVDPTCGAEVERHNLLTAESLGTDRDSGHFGYKLETLVTLIEKTPKDDRVLVFVQFDDLFDKVHETLTVYGIPTAVVKGTAKQQSDAITAFQSAEKAKDQKVLLLLATDSSSSGANLTSANWAIFVSPLFTDSKEKYKALATQAIGRIHRYGQTKTARVVHLLTHATKDIEVFEERNDLVVDDVIKTQATQRGEIVNPQRSKKHKFAKKVKAEKKAAAAKSKGKGKAKSESEDDDDDDAAPLVDSDDDKPIKKRAAPKISPAKAKGKGKAAVVDIASDSELEFESGATTSEEEDASDEESEAVSTADEAPKKRKASAKDEDDFELSDADADAASSKRAKPRPRRSAAPATITIDDSDESETEDESPAPAPEKAKASPAAKGKGKAAPAPAKRRRVIAESSDDEEASPVPVAKKKAPQASTSKASEPAAKKRKTSTSSSFIVEVPSPKKSQSSLNKWFKRKEEEIKQATSSPASAKASQQTSVAKASQVDEEPERDDHDVEMREDTPSPTKKAPTQTAPEEEQPAPAPAPAPAPETAAASANEQPSAAAPVMEDATPAVEEQQRSTPAPAKEPSPAPAKEVSPPAALAEQASSPAPPAVAASVAESAEATSGPGSKQSSPAADEASTGATEQGDEVGTALTTPADELMRELGAGEDMEEKVVEESGVQKAAPVVEG